MEVAAIRFCLINMSFNVFYEGVHKVFAGMFVDELNTFGWQMIIVKSPDLEPRAIAINAVKAVPCLLW